MKAIEITQPGKPEVLKPGVRPDPVPGAGELLIRVRASGINRPDVLQRKGAYPPPAGASDLPGLEVAGEVAGGAAAELAAAGFKVGDRVCALVAGGGYAELCVAPIGQCLPVPAGFSDVEAASLPETFFTVWSNVFDRGRLQAGETLLVQGGSSGIGVTAIQLGKALGATVIVTAGDDAKCQACLALGADHAINYKDQDFAAEVLRLTEGRGVDVVLDMVGGDYVPKNLDALKTGGRIVFIAAQGGGEVPLQIFRLMQKRALVTGSTLRPRDADEKARLAAEIERVVWPWIAAGKVKPQVDATFPLEEAAAAHAHLEGGAHVGKVILTTS